MSTGNGTKAGLVGFSNNGDWYSFTLLHPETVTMTLSYNGYYVDNGLDMALYDSGNNQLAYVGASQLSNASIVQTLGAGTYYVDVLSSNTAAYIFNVTDATPTVGGPGTKAGGSSLTTATQLGTLGASSQSFAGWVGTANTQDVYAFNVSGSAAFHATLSGLSDSADIILENASGQTIDTAYGNASSNASLNEFLAPLAAGTYFLVVDNYGASTGSTGYNLALSTSLVGNTAGATSGSAQSMGQLGTVAESFSGMVDPVDPTVWYSFTVGGPSTVSLLLSGLTAGAEMKVWAANGTSLIEYALGGYNYNTSIIRQLPSLQAGTYFVSVFDTANLSAHTAFQLTAQATPVLDIAGDTETAARPISLSATPESFTGMVSPVNTADIFAFTLDATTAINVALSGYGSEHVGNNADVALVAASGATADATGTHLGSVQANYGADGLFANVLTAGTYYAEVLSYGNSTASYTLTLSTGAPQVGSPTGNNPGGTQGTALDIGTLGTVAVGESAWAGNAHTTDMYQFEVAQTSLVRLDTTGVAANNYLNLTLTDVSGSSLATAQENGGSGGSIIKVLSAGTYFLTAKNTGTAGTGFNLQASAIDLVGPAGGSLATAQKVGALGTIAQTFSGYVGPTLTDAFYQFSVAAASTVTLDLSTPANGARVSIDNISGNQIVSTLGGSTSDGWGGANLVAGTYYVDVSSIGSPTDYSLSMTANTIADTAGATFTTATSLGTLDAAQSAACFAAGTRLATSRGLVAVERLRAGDEVLCADGSRAPVIWRGHRRVDCRRHPRPHDVWPVRVRAEAFGAGVPTRDVLLSPDHAMFADGVLVPVRYLVNGRTIVQEPCRQITYWHVELPRHGVLLAEGLPAESYLDTGNRGAFVEGGDMPHLHADFALRVWAAEACAPLVLEGETLTGLRRRLLDRAAAIGHAQTDDPDLRVIAAGRVLRPEGWGSRRSVRLPPGTRGVRIVSRCAVPAEMRADATDCRRLGVALRHIVHDGAMIALDDPRLVAGWHAPEYADGVPDFRWTDGDARLAVSGGGWLEIVLAMTERYWGRGHRRRRAA